VQARIVAAAALSSDDVALEIGAGLGALTGHLLAQAGRVIAVERDPDMVRVLRGEFANEERLEIRAMDALEIDFAAEGAAAGGDRQPPVSDHHAAVVRHHRGGPAR
jgi:16S rRNA (adenine1518-N6/adenine1519-N6)-dimethyltransferase